MVNVMLRKENEHTRTILSTIPGGKRGAGRPRLRCLRFFPSIISSIVPYSRVLLNLPILYFYFRLISTTRFMAWLGYILTYITINVGGDRLNPGKRILPLSSVNCHIGRRMSGKRPRQLLALRMETVLGGRWTKSGWKPGNEMGILPYYYLPEKTWNFTSGNKRTSENLSDGTLQQYSLPQVRTC